MKTALDTAVKGGKVERSRELVQMAIGMHVGKVFLDTLQVRARHSGQNHRF